MFRILSPSWSSGKMLLCVMALLFPAALSGSVPTSDDSAAKNHRLEKRIDDLMLYGGWQPVSKQPPRYGAESRPRPYRHDLLAALPDGLDAAASYYRQAVPKSKGYSKDIYSYYPRPAIRSAPRKNTPIYMETYKPRHHQSSSGGGHFAPQIIDIQKLDLRHLRDLHDVILKAQELPLSQLNIGAPSGKHVELVVQSLGGRGGGGRGGYGRGRQRGGGKGFPRAPSFPRSSPVQVEYIPLPAIQGGKGHQQILPKDAGLSPLRLPHADGLDLKNIQIVEVEVPPGFKYGGKSQQQHNKRGNRPSQHRNVAQQQKYSFPSKSFFPSKSNGLFQSKYNFAAEKQPEIEAQLIKLSEEQLKHLMKSLQVVDKHSTQDLYKYLPKLEKSKGGDIHLIVALPQLSHLGGSYSSGNQQQDSGYQQQDNGYQQQDSGYQQQDSGYQQQDNGYQQQDDGYQHQEEDGGYQQQDGGYQQQQENSYEAEGQQHVSYPSQDGHHQHQSEAGDGGYGYSHSEGGYHQEGYQEQSSVHQAGYGTRGHGGGGGGEAYIEVINAETDDGYKREPVLAVELKEGQTIEEAIQSLDPETLKKIGAHGKDGIEIEVVEVPMGEYVAESKKAVASVVAPQSTKKVEEKAVVVPSQNGTTTTAAEAKT